MTNYESFLGKKVNVTKSIEKQTFSFGEREFTNYHLEDDNADLTELQDQIKKSGMKVRVWLPSTIGTMDYRMDRVNIVIKEVDSEFQITRIYIG